MGAPLSPFGFIGAAGYHKRGDAYEAKLLGEVVVEE